MRRHRLLLLFALLILAALPAARLLLDLRGGPDGGRVYTVAGILNVVRRAPGLWDGRVVRVRGTVEPGLMLARDNSRLPSVAPAAPEPGYVPLAAGASAASVLWVAGSPGGGLTALLRRLPVVAGLLPGQRVPRLGAVSTYRVELHVDPARCPSPTCVVGTFVDYTAPAVAPVGFPRGASSPAVQ
jgi:hypothetical protein